MDLDLSKKQIDIEIKKSDINIDKKSSNIFIDIKKNEINTSLTSKKIEVSAQISHPAGSNKYTIIDINEDYTAEQLTGNYLLKCSGEISITLPITTEAIFSIRNENGQITITNEVNGEENKVLKYINSSITLISIGDGKYNII